LPRAGEWAQVAAAQAAELLAFDRAARLYRLSLEYSPDARELRIKLGEALANAGRGAEAARAYLAAREGASAVESRVLQRRAAEQFLLSGHVDEGCAHMREVLRGLGMDLPSSPSSAMAAFLWGRTRLRLRGLHWKERAATELAPEVLERVDTCWSVARGFNMIDVLVSQQFHTRHMLLALEAGEPHRIARGLAIEPTIVSATGNFARGDEMIEKAAALAERLGDPHALGIVALQSGTVDFMRGRFAAARGLFERAERLFRDRCTAMSCELATAQALQHYSLFYLGELALLAHLVPEQIRQAEERGDLFTALNGRITYSNLAWLIADDIEGARRAVDDALARWSSAGFHVQHFAALTARVNIELYAGDGAAAWRWMEAQWHALKRSILYRVQSSRMEAHSLRGRAALAAATVAGPARGERLQQAEKHARALAAGALPHTGGLALLLRAGAAALAGDGTRAAAELDAAIAAFDGSDLALYAAVARHRRGQLGDGENGRALRDGAIQFLRAQKVQVPTRIIRMLAPGFPDDE
jgi:tetratricopeptide (TPR) repeat protein